MTVVAGVVVVAVEGVVVVVVGGGGVKDVAALCVWIHCAVSVAGVDWNSQGTWRTSDWSLCFEVVAVVVVGWVVVVKETWYCPSQQQQQQ